MRTPHRTSGSADAPTCRACAAALPEGANFCTGCGVPTALAPVARRRAAAPEQRARTPRLVECDACGAGNAASRPLCARCGSPLRDEVPGGDALPDTVRDPVPAGAGPRQRLVDGPPLLLSLVVLAGLVTAGVLLALVTSRVRADDVTAVPAGLALRDATSSSALADHPPALAIDGDPATAWAESDEGDGAGEWLEVQLAQEVSVSGLVVWNGDQVDEERWAQRGAAAVVRIEVGGRQFRVGLQDVLGPQAIDLPGDVTGDRVRLVVEEAEPGRRIDDLAISEVVVDGG